jgi:hypothetical protein
MAALAGYQASLKLGGTPVDMTNEEVTSIGGEGEYVYRITDATKRVLDPATAVVVYHGATPYNSADILSIDYVLGVVTVDPNAYTEGTHTVSAKYVPLFAVAQGTAVEVVPPQRVMAESTIFGDAARRAQAVSWRCSISLSHLDAWSDQYDTDYAVTFWDAISAGEPVFCELKIGTTAGQYVRGWFTLDASARADSGPSLVGNKLNLDGVIRACVGRTTDQALFSVATF